jgi:hypothetical protein
MRHVDTTTLSGDVVSSLQTDNQQQPPLCRKREDEGDSVGRASKMSALQMSVAVWLLRAAS